MTKKYTDHLIVFQFRALVYNLHFAGQQASMSILKSTTAFPSNRHRLPASLARGMAGRGMKQ